MLFLLLLFFVQLIKSLTHYELYLLLVLPMKKGQSLITYTTNTTACIVLRFEGKVGCLMRKLASKEVLNKQNQQSS